MAAGPVTPPPALAAAGRRTKIGTMTKARPPLALILLAVLCACSTAADRAAYLNALVGHSEADAVRQLGVPSRTFEAGGRRFLAYDARQSATFYGIAVVGGYYGSGWYPGFPDEVVTRQCETTLEVANDRVVTWSLRGPACG